MEEVKRGRGRPAGSLNKKGRKEKVTVLDENGNPRGKGRPKGSKNKPKPPKIGRPKGKKSGYTVSEKALAQRQTNVLENFGKKMPVTEEGREYNARLIEHIMKVNEISVNADRNDLNTLKSCFIAYLQLCQADGFNVSNLAAYSAMGFYNYNQFESFARKDDPDIRTFCTFVKSTCAMVRENKIADSKINPVIGIFWQRNFDGLRNDTEQVQNNHNDDDLTASGKAYKEKYKNLIGE